MSGSLKLRLFAGAGFFIALGVVATWLSLQQIFSGYVAAQYEREMSTVVDTLAASLEFADEAPVVGRSPADPRYALPAGGRYWAVEPDSGEPLRSRSLWDVALKPADLVDSRYEAFRRGDGPDGRPILVLARTLSFETETGARDVVFLAGFAADEMEHALADFRHELALMLGLTAFMLLTAAALQVLIGLRPLRLLRADVANIRTGSASRLRSDVPTEVKPLVAELNELLDEKASALERARARAADLAHGLKTPLTAIQQIAETLPPDAGRPIIEHVAMIRRRADRQLQRARMGVGPAEGSELGVIVGKLVQVISAMPAERKIVWRTAIPDGFSVSVDPADIAEALGNILDNARKWAASQVVISAAGREAGIVISVSDDGSGIAPEDGDRILERGVHAGDPESETGLGLAIAREIVEAYGGSLNLDAADIGGLRVTLALPDANTARKAGRPGRASSACIPDTSSL